YVARPAGRAASPRRAAAASAVLPAARSRRGRPRPAPPRPTDRSRAGGGSGAECGIPRGASRPTPCCVPSEAGAFDAGAAHLERLDLSLEAVDLVLVLRPTERITIDAERVARVAGARVGVPQVLDDGRIVPRQLDGTLELLDRAPVVAALVVHPAEAVDVEAVVGIELEGASDETLCLIQLRAHLRVGVAQIVERGGVLRIQRDRTLHLLDGPRLVLRVVVGGAECETVAVVLGEAFDHALEQRDRTLDILPLAIECGEIAHELRVVGLRLEGGLHLADGFGEAIALLQDVGTLDARVDVVLRIDGHTIELGERAIQLADLRVDRSEVVADAPIVRLGREHEVELGGGALWITLLEIDEPDLGARLARIRVHPFELAELRERIVELLLPDVDAAQPAADQDALRIERQDSLVELDRLVGPTLQLVGERQVRQNELRLRVQLERFEIVVLGLVELACGGVHTAEVVVAEDRVRVAAREPLEGGDGAVGLATLAVERAEKQIRVLAVRIDLQEVLVGRRCFVLAAERRLHAGEQ